VLSTTFIIMVKKRSPNFSQSNIDKMLELIEESHPCRIDEWDLITSLNSRLKNVRKAMGDPNIPPNALRAKLAQRENEACICIQTLGGDESHDDTDSADGGFPREGAVDDNFR
jgi:hypothetical protein